MEGSCNPALDLSRRKFVATLYLPDRSRVRFVEMAGDNSALVFGKWSNLCDVITRIRNSNVKSKLRSSSRIEDILAFYSRKRGEGARFALRGVN